MNVKENKIQNIDDCLTLLLNKDLRENLYSFVSYQNETLTQKEIEIENRLEQKITFILNEKISALNQVQKCLKMLKKEIKKIYGNTPPHFFSHNLNLFQLASFFDETQTHDINALIKCFSIYEINSFKPNSFENEEIKSLMRDFEIKELIFKPTNTSSTKDTIDYIKKQYELTQKVFNIEKKELGENELSLHLLPCVEKSKIKEIKNAGNLGEIEGFFFKEHSNITLFFNSTFSEKEYLNFIHEYTHFRQKLAQFKTYLKNDFDLLYKEVFLTHTPVKKQENFEKTITFLTPFFENIQPIKNYLEKELNQSKKLNVLTELKRKYEIKSILKSTLFQDETVVKSWTIPYKIIENKLLNHNNLYSYEHNTWVQRDKKIKSVYWMDAEEIHARINSELINKNVVHANQEEDKDFSKETLEKLKTKIPLFNELCIQVYKDMKKNSIKKLKFN